MLNVNNLINLFEKMSKVELKNEVVFFDKDNEVYLGATSNMGVSENFENTLTIDTCNHGYLSYQEFLYLLKDKKINDKTELIIMDDDTPEHLEHKIIDVKKVDDNETVLVFENVTIY